MDMKAVLLPEGAVILQMSDGASAESMDEASFVHVLSARRRSVPVTFTWRVL